MRWNLEPMRNNTSKFFIRTWLLPSSKACSFSSQLRLRLWTTSETSDWSSQTAIPGVWPSVSTPVGTSSLPETLGANSASPAKTRRTNHCPKNESTLYIRENLTLNRSRERSFPRSPLSGHPPPNWEHQLQTRITTESIRRVPEISGRTNGSPEQIYAKTQ